MPCGLLPEYTDIPPWAGGWFTMVDRGNGGYDGNGDYYGGGGATSVAVPEPGSLILVGAFIGSLALRRRSRD